MLWLRPWGFPTVSPSHPNVLPHHDIRQISVEFTADPPKVRGQYLLHAPRRRRRDVGSHSPQMVRLLRMSNSANLSKEGLPHAWPLDKR